MPDTLVALRMPEESLTARGAYALMGANFAEDMDSVMKASATR